SEVLRVDDRTIGVPNFEPKEFREESFGRGLGLQSKPRILRCAPVVTDGKLDLADIPTKNQPGEANLIEQLLSNFKRQRLDQSRSLCSARSVVIRASGADRYQRDA